MNYVEENFKINARGRADEKAVVKGPNVRFTVLTSGLIRLEYSKSGVFEDLPSQAFWYRKQEVPKFDKIVTDDYIEIVTDCLQLKYNIQSEGFINEALTIKILENNMLWTYGKEDKGNLGGTVRTLDGVNGPVPLENGLLSKEGWTVIDDSNTLVFENNEWLKERYNKENIDLYFFAYGKKYVECLRDYYKISGKTPLIPRWALGNWWSRYCEYSEEDLITLMDEFRSREIPLSVCIVDMDWHIVHNEFTRGWTGYTWNKELFPEPEKFIKKLHERGLKTALNLHPADGIHPHEEQYEAMAEFMRIDPKSKKPVEFDISDPNFMEAYFRILHHPLEKQGVDFWWMDWQQGEGSKLKGLDPLWWLNHLHYMDLGRNSNNRPMVFTRWSALGNQRYPIGFSGDTIVSWESLAFQPYFTATAANTACTWWSHDIGGHMNGIENGEMYTRWVEFGVFSPIMRLHSTKNPFQDRRPWAFNETVYEICKEYMQLRHALIPYIYTMAYKNELEDRALISPMYYYHPEKEEAYLCPQQYYFGSELIAAPYVSPMDEYTNMSRQVVWLAEGEWFDFFTGEHYYGDGFVTRYGSLNEIPVFAREGAIVPMAPRVSWGGLENPKELEINVFPGKDNSFELFEDDGNSMSYKDGYFCVTEFKQKWKGNYLEFIINPSRGNTSVIPEERQYVIKFKSLKKPENIIVEINSNRKSVPFSYDDKNDELIFSGIELSSADELKVSISGENGLMSRRDRTVLKVEKLLTKFSISNCAKYGIMDDIENIVKNPALLSKFVVDLSESSIKALIETIKPMGMYSTNASGEEIIILWNNSDEDGISYNLSTAKWNEYKAEGGKLPKFKRINPDKSRDKWQLNICYYNLFVESIKKYNRKV